MKQLPIKTPHYKQLQKSFNDWLTVMGYAKGTIESFPIHLREFFHYLEERNVNNIKNIKSRHYDGFITHLKIRNNKRYKSGALSTSTINKTIQSINTFAKFVNQNHRISLDIKPRHLHYTQEVPQVLTQKEIGQLYEATYIPHRLNTEAMGQRDRAILAIFYGCGLRKSEGSALNITDINLEKRLLFVRKGKGNKQRYVPIANKAAADIRAYLEKGRYWFLEYQYRGIKGRQYVNKTNADSSAALFLGITGKRMLTFYKRFEYLQKEGVVRPFSTHTLRHSIATHLLQSGMDIEEIAKFLGHSSLESTQLYTHIITLINNADNRQ